MPRTYESTPLAPSAPLPPALFAKLAPLAAIAGAEQLLDVAAELDASPHPLPLFAAHVRRLAIALDEVRAAVRGKLGPAPFSRVPDEGAARYAVTAAGLEALTDPDANDVADECPVTLSLSLESPRTSPPHGSRSEGFTDPRAARAGVVPSRVLPANAGLEAGSLPHTRHPANPVPYSVQRALALLDGSRGVYLETSDCVVCGTLQLAGEPCRVCSAADQGGASHAR